MAEQNADKFNTHQLNNEITEPLQGTVQTFLSPDDEKKFQEKANKLEAVGRFPSRTKYADERGQWDKDGNLIGERKDKMKARRDELRGKGREQVEVIEAGNQQTLSAGETFASVEQKDAMVALQDNPKKQAEVQQIFEPETKLEKVNEDITQTVETVSDNETLIQPRTLESGEKLIDASSEILDSTNPNPQAGEIVDAVAYKNALDAGKPTELTEKPSEDVSNADLARVQELADLPKSDTEKVSTENVENNVTENLDNVSNISEPTKKRK